MKTKHWILLFLALALLCGIAALALVQYAPEADSIEICSNGKPVRTVPLSVDGEYRIESEYGWNVVTVRGGKASVTAASCPTQDCVRHGAASSGAPIVCLPNRLTVTFCSEPEYDALLQ